MANQANKQTVNQAVKQRVNQVIKQAVYQADRTKMQQLVVTSPGETFYVKGEL